MLKGLDLDWLYLDWQQWVHHLTPHLVTAKVLLQFALIFACVTWIYFKIQGTYVSQLLKSVTVIMGLYLVSSAFGLTIISSILEAVLMISVIGFIILFQPELRRLFVTLGQPDLLSRHSGGSLRNKEYNAQHVVQDLVDSSRLLSKTKTGGLIVIESATGLSGNYIEAGTAIDSHLSTELLLTIFHTNTPLHDGAVVLSPEGRIIAAGVLLPLSENPNLSWKYGTRHRAAIGLSEISDCQCIVISEETGNISWVTGGTIEKMASVDDLRHHLEIVFGLHDIAQTKDKKLFFLHEFFPTELIQRLFNSANTGQTPVVASAKRQQGQKSSSEY